MLYFSLGGSYCFLNNLWHLNQSLNIFCHFQQRNKAVFDWDVWGLRITEVALVFNLITWYTWILGPIIRTAWIFLVKFHLYIPYDGIFFIFYGVKNWKKLNFFLRSQLYVLYNLKNQACNIYKYRTYNRNLRVQSCKWGNPVYLTRAIITRSRI